MSDADWKARAMQAEADARLMLAAYFGADGASVARFGLGEGLLSEFDLQRLDALRDATFYTSEADTAAAMLRVLATAPALASPPRHCGRCFGVIDVPGPCPVCEDAPFGRR